MYLYSQSSVVPDVQAPRGRILAVSSMQAVLSSSLERELQSRSYSLGFSLIIATRMFSSKSSTVGTLSMGEDSILSGASHWSWFSRFSRNLPMVGKMRLSEIEQSARATKSDVMERSFRLDVVSVERDAIPPPKPENSWSSSSAVGSNDAGSQGSRSWSEGNAASSKSNWSLEPSAKFGYEAASLTAVTTTMKKERWRSMINDERHRAFSRKELNV